MTKCFQRFFSAILILVLVFQLTPTALPALAADTVALTDHSFNGEGLWITEIYNNDVDCSTKNDSRKQDGYWSIDLFTSASDLMEFIEVCSTHDAPISLNDLYELQIDGITMSITDMAGNSNITLTKGQPVVIWNYRTDVAMPTENQLRNALRIPDEALVLKVNYGSNWPAASGTFCIKSRATGKDVSSFTALQDTHTKDGMGVELKMPVMKKSAMEVYRALNLPSAGRVYAAQLNGLITAKIPAGFNGKGVYITEVRPNDINRNSTYGTDSDLMECFEITNTTDADVDLSTQYQITYTVKEGFRKPLTLYKYSSSASDHIGNTTNMVVPAGSSAVIWCYRFSHLTDYTSYPTLTQFRNAYGLTTSTKVYLIKDQNGLTNDNRAIELFKKNANGSVGDLVSSYCYLGASDCANDLSAQLKINPEGPAMQLYAGNAASTIGTVEAEQLSYVIDDGSHIAMRFYDGFTLPESIMQGEDLRAFFYYENTGKLTRLVSSTYYRFDGKGSWILSTEGGIRVPNRYETVIPAYELFDHDYVEFYVTSGNEYRNTYKGIYKVQINKLNDVDGIRTNISNNETLKGTVSITANNGGSNSSTKIYIDGVKQTTTPMLEDGAYFMYQVDDIDSYFRTAITTTKNEVIYHIGHWAFVNPANQARHIDNSLFTYKSGTDTYDVTLRFWAGNYGSVAQDPMFPDANREDFSVTALQMKLVNGKTYLPKKIGPSSYNGVDTSEKTNLSTALDAVHYIGDSSTRCPYMNVAFSIPASEVTAVGTQLDTTKLSESPHTLKVTDGTNTREVTFIVDNTAPKISLGVKNGESLTGLIALNPQITDISNLNEFTVLLDDEKISIPYETTANSLGEGSHTLSVYAADAAGNEATAKATFTVDRISMTLTNAGAQDITHSSAMLYLNVQSDTDGQATFYKAEKIETAQIETFTSEGILPYIQYTIDVGQAAAGDEVRVSWDGEASTADNTHITTMYVRNVLTGQWDTVAEVDKNGSIENVFFPVENHVENGKVTVIVQCTAESALPDLDSVTDGVIDSGNDWDGVSVPEHYDFSFAWITDTQGYVQRYPKRFLHMNQWIVDNAERLNIRYVMHTGDIVDDWDAIYQWESAEEAMRIFDDAGMPYGVLAGNHDIGSGLDMRDNYYTYWNEDRVKDQYVFGESYENNYGHYDLVSENGQDFIIVYMSWNINQKEIDWMNEVLAKHSNRKAILCFHAYTHVRESTDGLLDYWGCMIRDHVVAKNPNVFAVLNGHYSGSTYQTVRFDDNGDGKLDRTVYQLCTDYQNLDKGGLEYIKFLYFDIDNNKVFINAYSPYLDDFNYYDTAAPDRLTSLAKDSSSGVVSNTDIDAVMFKLDMNANPQTILEDRFSAYLYTDEVLTTGKLNHISGNVSGQMDGLTGDTEYLWYARIENENTGTLKTDVYSITTAKAPTAPTIALKYPTLSFEDVILMNVYFDASDLQDVAQMGLITYSQRVTDWNITNAEAVVPGYHWSDSDGLYYATTRGIPAKCLGDTIYFAVYAQLTDGTYVYTSLISYSPKNYAYNQLNTGNEEMRSLVAAMLNYGAAAQLYFNYHTDALVNSGMTEQQQALVSPYSEDMMTKVTQPTGDQLGEMVSNGGYIRRYPTISFEGAFCINYYFLPENAPAGDVTMYLWNQKDYDAAGSLSRDNATQAIPMTLTDSGEYLAIAESIPAKDLDKGLYVSFCFSDGNTEYCSGVIGYSIGTYCVSQASKTGTIASLAAATAVYGYYAKNLFYKSAV